MQVPKLNSKRWVYLILATFLGTLSLVSLNSSAANSEDDIPPDLDAVVGGELDLDSDDQKNTKPSEGVSEAAKSSEPGDASLDNAEGVAERAPSGEGDLPDEELSLDDVDGEKQKEAMPKWQKSGQALGADKAGEGAARITERNVAEDGTPIDVTNVEFKMDGDKSDIVIRSSRTPSLVENQTNQPNQLVYILENTQTPEKLQRAYDTSEFRSPVALFAIFQVPGATTPTAKLIIQMRENVHPEINKTDRGIIMTFPAASDAGREVVLGEKKKEILSGENVFAPNQKFQGEVIERLEIKNSDVQDVLRLIARTSGFNIVIGDDVAGNVGTLSLENIPWDQAFTLVLQSKRLSYVREGNVIRVGTATALKVEKDEAYRIEEAARRVEPLKTLLIPVNFAAAGTLAPRMTSLLSERGKVETDDRTNTLIVKDIEANVVKVQKLVSVLDTPPARVQINARIMEVKNTFSRTLGISQNNFTPRLGAISFDQRMTFLNDDASVTTISSADASNLQLRLTMGELNSESRTLANPSISVVANQTATITQKSTIFLQTTTVTVAGASQSYIQVPVTMTMNVKPIVAGDGSIFMTLTVNNDIPTTVGTRFSVDTRNVTTQVLIENGGTAVIGGVFQNATTESRQGIPLLKDIPILGFLVSNRQQSEIRNQILVFLSARILNAEEHFKRAL